jgi:hypothetical protein
VQRARQNKIVEGDLGEQTGNWTEPVLHDLFEVL